MRIICVDDEKLILNLTVSMCRELRQKPEAVGFQKAAEALEDLKQNGADIALLDINLPDMSGLELAARMKGIKPNLVIIFLTGYSEYAVDAINLRASGYLMKPVSQERLAQEIDYAEGQIMLRRQKSSHSNVFVRTFGYFEVFVNGNVVKFSRSRSKELFAYLVDNNGAFVSRADAFSVLWENQAYDRPMQKQLDVILRSMRQTLEQYGIGDIVEMKSGSIRAVPEKFDCDLYRFYQGDVKTVNSFQGEYMSDYSWANITEANLTAQK